MARRQDNQPLPSLSQMSSVVHSNMWGGHLWTTSSFIWIKLSHLSKLTEKHKLPVQHWRHCLKVFLHLSYTVVQEEDEAICACVCVRTDKTACFWENVSALPCELWENPTVVQRKTCKWKKWTSCVCTTNNMMLWQATILSCVGQKLYNFMFFIVCYLKSYYGLKRVKKKEKVFVVSTLNVSIRNIL